MIVEYDNPVFQYNFIPDPQDEYFYLTGLPNEPDHLFYFWTENWADVGGPYETYPEAVDAVKQYCREFLA